jgi:hypothetical protein
VRFVTAHLEAFRVPHVRLELSRRRGDRRAIATDVAHVVDVHHGGVRLVVVVVVVVFVVFNFRRLRARGVGVPSRAQPLRPPPRRAAPPRDRAGSQLDPASRPTRRLPRVEASR